MGPKEIGKGLGNSRDQPWLGNCKSLLPQFLRGIASWVVKREEKMGPDPKNWKLGPFELRRRIKFGPRTEFLVE